MRESVGPHRFRKVVGRGRTGSGWFGISTFAPSVQLLVLERREPAANMARFYVLSLEETLFGDTALIREWGRLGTAGRRRLDLFEARAQTREALDSWLGRKLRRGYGARLQQG